MRENVVEEMRQMQPNDETKRKMLNILARFHSGEEEEDHMDEDGMSNCSFSFFKCFIRLHVNKMCCLLLIRKERVYAQYYMSLLRCNFIILIKLNLDLCIFSLKSQERYWSSMK